LFYICLAKSWILLSEVLLIFPLRIYTIGSGSKYMIEDNSEKEWLIFLYNVQRKSKHINLIIFKKKKILFYYLYSNFFKLYFFSWIFQILFSYLNFSNPIFLFQFHHCKGIAFCEKKFLIVKKIISCLDLENDT
jgi:hypothetical protein